MFHLIWTILIGFVVGFIAKSLLHEAAGLGFWLTAGLGIVGSFVGGLISRLFSNPKDGSLFHPAGLIMSIVGAVIVLYAYTHYGH
jgi:uncharacterized membrane protein YeaQ/YmgE (transglycosylase-associated protein family)